MTGPEPAERPQWRNWAGNQRCAPSVIERPRGGDAVAAVVRRAADAGERVKAVGAGHSFTATACTDGRMLDLTGHDRVVSHDADRQQVRVESGISLAALNRELDRLGLALPNLGDIAYQSIAGATQTATHGTGLGFHNLAMAIVAMTLVDGSGEVVECSADVESELLRVARVGLGALGLVSDVTLQCVPAFNLHAVEDSRPVDECLEGWDELCRSNDHFEFFWIPHTRIALTKENRRTTEPVDPLPRWRAWRDDYVYDNLWLELLCRLGRVAPSRVPSLARRLPSAGRREYVDRSYSVFASPRLVRFYETEWAVPFDAVPDALREVRALVDRIGLSVHFPVEVRCTKGDDIPLSTAHGRDTGYIACHVSRGASHDQYFQGVQRIMWAHGGRPHWGKMHFLDHDRLSTAYPEWDAFQAVRRRLDPDGRFDNPELERVLGPRG